MSDFQFLKNPVTGKWVVSAPRRSHRPDGQHHDLPCPFCPGHEGTDEVYRVSNSDGSWAIRAISNKFPFTPYHEVIIHSPDHARSFDTLPQQQVALILHTFRQRYNYHAEQGQVYIFHNHGHVAGESLMHPHSQLVVVPFDVQLDIPRLPHIQWDKITGEAMPMFTQKWWGWSAESEEDTGPAGTEDSLVTEHFYIFCPNTSEWPDEVWIAPKKSGAVFGDMNDAELKDLAITLIRLIQIFDYRHGREFPFNFYIYPGKNWYLRLIPRIKVLGGFELGTGVMVNTQEPEKTFEFIKEHFHQPNWEKIKVEHKASYRKKV